MELPKNLVLKIHEKPTLKDQKALLAVATFLGKLERTYRITIPLTIEMPNIQWPSYTKKNPAFPELVEAKNPVGTYWKGLQVIKKQLKEWTETAAQATQPKSLEQAVREMTRPPSREDMEAMIGPGCCGGRH